MSEWFGLDELTLLTGAVVFAARVVDMSVGTIRTIATVQGRTTLAFFLGLIEVTLWIFVVSTVINKIQDNPLLAIFYAFGFSTGNAVGILVEKRLAMGHQIVRLITPRDGPEMATHLRELGFRVTIFKGEGARGPVHELYVVCKRREARLAIKAAERMNPGVFYITETPGQVRRLRHQLVQKSSGWRAVFKRK
jgi:uncharacterized protein YebE (UPF0316 family)